MYSSGTKQKGSTNYCLERVGMCYCARYHFNDTFFFDADPYNPLPLFTGIKVWLSSHPLSKLNLVLWLNIINTALDGSVAGGRTVMFSETGFSVKRRWNNGGEGFRLRSSIWAQFETYFNWCQTSAINKTQMKIFGNLTPLRARVVPVRSYDSVFSPFNSKVNKNDTA